MKQKVNHCQPLRIAVLRDVGPSAFNLQLYFRMDSGVARCVKITVFGDAKRIVLRHLMFSGQPKVGFLIKVSVETCRICVLLGK